MATLTAGGRCEIAALIGCRPVQVVLSFDPRAGIYALHLLTEIRDVPIHRVVDAVERFAFLIGRGHVQCHARDAHFTRLPADQLPLI